MMNLNDLLDLLASEYESGLDQAKQSLAVRLVPEDAASSTNTQGETAAEDFIERSVAAAELVSLRGLAEYLQHALQVLASQRNDSADPLPVLWVSDALDHARSFIQAPATENAIQSILTHAEASPLQPNSDWLDLLAKALAAPPQIADDEDDLRQAAFDPITPDDVVLSNEHADPELLATLLHDAPTQLEKLFRILDAYNERSRSNVPHRPGSLAEAQRIAHTLKGSGNIIGLPGIAKISHRLEDTLIWLDGEAARTPGSELAAVRDALLSCETLQQMTAYLSGDDVMPAHALAVLERMQSWAKRIFDDEASEYAPPPVVIADQGAADSDTQPIGNTPRGSESTASLRVSTEQVGRLVKRAGQSLVSSQRLSQTLREIDQRLNVAQERQQALRARLDELQRTVERQVVALQARRDEEGAFDPLELDRYDALHLLSRVVAEAVVDQVEITEEVRNEARQLLADSREEHRELREQHRELIDTRLIAFSSIVPRLRRNIAQTSATVGKRARLEVEGEQTAVDADVLTMLTEPLLHLLRNAIDHGIESPEERILKGKLAEAVVLVRCTREGQQVRIEVRDDGRGIDTFAVLNKAVSLGIVGSDSELTTADIHALLLQRGFSTKEAVTDVSGRGIGLDVVNDRVKAMKGSLLIDSIANAGTTFSMKVPISSGIAQSVIASVAGEQVAISSDQVITVLAPGSAPIVQNSVEFAGETIQLASLSAWLGFDSGTALNFNEKSIIVAHGAGSKIGLAVDRVDEVRELILQDIGSLLRKIAGVQTGALTDAGSPLFVVDVPDLQIRARSGFSLSASLALRQRAATERTRILVVDDALSARRAVQHVFEDSGYEVHTASDGFEALDLLRKHQIALVATDLEMPNLNGLELTKRMREVPAWAAIPVVMITSRSGDRHRQTAVDFGVNDYFVKPFADAQLLRAAQQLLSQNPPAPLARVA